MAEGERFLGHRRRKDARKWKPHRHGSGRNVKVLFGKDTNTRKKAQKTKPQKGFMPKNKSKKVYRLMLHKTIFPKPHLNICCISTNYGNITFLSLVRSVDRLSQYCIIISLGLSISNKPVFTSQNVNPCTFKWVKCNLDVQYKMSHCNVCRLLWLVTAFQS